MIFLARFAMCLTGLWWLHTATNYVTGKGVDSKHMTTGLLLYVLTAIVIWIRDDIYHERKE